MVNSGCLEGENERERGRKGGKCINLWRVRSESSWGNNKQNIWRRRRSIWPNGMCANCLMGQQAACSTRGNRFPTTPLPPSPLLPAARLRHYLIHEVQIGKNVSKENAAKETSAQGKRGEREQRWRR